MTRENKLALVVGFGLLLFVGILVSDHFSAAHRQESVGFGVASSASDRTTRSITLAPMPAANAVSLQPQPAQGGSGIQQASAVTPISSMPAPPQVVSTTPMETAPQPEVRRVSARQESEPGVKMHPIAEGETLYAICKREYGDGSLSTALAKYNRKAIPDPTRIRKGVTIRIPPVEVLKPGAARKTESASVPEAGVGVPVAAMAAADIVTIDSRTPIGGEVTLEVKPQPEPKAKAAPKAAAKSSPKQSTGKPTKKPVAAKSPDR
jgi:hypothetical protein